MIKTLRWSETKGRTLYHSQQKQWLEINAGLYRFGQDHYPFHRVTKLFSEMWTHGMGCVTGKLKKLTCSILHARKHAICPMGDITSFLKFAHCKYNPEKWPRQI